MLPIENNLEPASYQREIFSLSEDKNQERSISHLAYLAITSPFLWTVGGVGISFYFFSLPVRK